MICLSRKLGFSATHVYHIESWSEDKNREVFGPCSNPNGHGHDYSLEVVVRGPIDERSGMVVNVTDIDKVVQQLLEEEFDGKFLDREHPYFRQRIPTTESIVTYLWQALDGSFPNCELYKLRLYESPFLFTDKGRDALVHLTRKYHFCAAHRLHSHQLTEEENRQIFGKCNNPHGHGHNYYLDVTVSGEPDPITGMIIDLAWLDRTVESQVLQKFDHKHLNLDTQEFADTNPTSENIAVVIWQLLSKHVPKLSKVGLWETEKNYFEYSGREEIGSVRP